MHREWYQEMISTIVARGLVPGPLDLVPNRSTIYYRR